VGAVSGFIKGEEMFFIIDILSENSKKEYPKSVTELLKLEEKRLVQGICYFTNKIPKFILKKK
jgi:hypothetical protein